MGGAVGDCNGLTENVVRYDSPTFGGFSVSASWGEDDMWDVAARYSGEYNGFKLAVAAAYNQVSAGFCNDFIAATLWMEPAALALAATTTLARCMPTTSRLVPTLSMCRRAFGSMAPTASLTTTRPALWYPAVPEQDTWYVKAGLRERWHPLGHTVLYGEYETVRDAYQVESGDFRLWGLGIVQEIDAAAMSIWVSYRNIEADDHDADAQEDFGSSEATFQYIKAGALINF